MRILLVDDSPTILTMLSMVLRQNGFTVHAASDGVDALDQFKQHEMDLVLTDVNMPRMNGFTLITQIRGLPNGADTPIVVLSTEASENDHQNARQKGADLYLVKPLSTKDLVFHIRSLLNK